MPNVTQRHRPSLVTLGRIALAGDGREAAAAQQPPLPDDQQEHQRQDREAQRRRVLIVRRRAVIDRVVDLGGDDR